MREITFRGKRIDTEEWVTGHFVRLYDDKGHHSHRIYPGYAETDCGDFYPDWYEVDPETVGQFTGPTDKHGKPIFEGDILEFGSEIFVMKYIHGFAAYALRSPDNMRAAPSINTISVTKMEIIGNIHDNPELIGGKADG